MKLSAMRTIIEKASSFVRRPWTVLVGGWLAASLLLGGVVGEAARRDAIDELERQASAGAVMHAAVLRSELEKQRAIPAILAEDPDVAGLLRSPDTGAVDRVDRKLERLAIQTRAAVIYVLDAKGLTLASSNWQAPTSFVGIRYDFRPYFTNAMRDAKGEFYALGTRSGRPGLYLSRRVDASDGTPLGVVVLKLEFDALESEWRSSGEPAWVADPGGVVLVTSVPEWRFRTTGTMDETRRRLSQIDLTLRPDALAPLPFQTPNGDRPRLVRTAVGEGRPQTWMHSKTVTATPGWTLHLLTPERGVVGTAVAGARGLALLITSLLALAAALLLRRRHQAIARARAEEEGRLELERRIRERTHELHEANLALNRQIDERRRAEAARELLRDELVQASKLAALGQIVASVAHEINQPVAAIWTHADTAVLLLERDQPDKARDALRKIGDLTRRIGAITQDLRLFSRKAAPSIDAIELEDAIQGGLQLTRGRLEEGGISLERIGGGEVRILADQFRLEQVIVNLIKNAAEAMEGQDDARLILSIERQGERVRLIFADNGPGVAPEVAGQLFTPFVTTRANGLGLGLVICRDIIASFGGELDLIPSARGATFIASLKAA
ncbi:sensor histidine kinase [Brevundimonas sp. SL130]|uniref:sensor histidine kinase n=1 Tax=Brevundimonas sp. SL130 TaxID=2995143 RepID=UPI00226C7569|nr:ATP-binding protein [Brevundimonas sp. SL130]WAC59511.1 ATP-binding protein [Brevundimonas sp. SL130]